jgi:PKD repeat protein
MMCIYPDAPIIIDISTAPDVTYTTLTTNAASYYWDFGDSTGASGMSQSHTYNLPGTYTVALVVDYGCGPDSLFQTISPVFIGIEEMISDVEKTFEIYPNPASDEITLTSQTIGGKMTIAITDMSGRVIIPYVCTNESNAHLGTADISRLNPGMYYITILSDQTVTSRKLIKF